MSTELHKHILYRITDEAFNQGKVEVLDEVVTPDAVDHTPPPGFTVGGREAYKQFVRELRIAFPDLHSNVEQAIAEGDKAVSMTRTRGTHRGSFMGIEPTGKHVEWTEIHIVRMENGKIVEHWGEADVMGLLQQLGVVPVTA